MTKEEKREYDKKYNQANKDKRKQKKKEYYIQNKDKIKECRKATKEEKREYDKKYGKSENGKKNRIIKNWINKCKIKFEDRNESEFYYNTYINTHRCTWCDKAFENSLDRHMDHCHTCGLPRAIICRSCNTKDLVPCVSCFL
tara:strand:+ start:28 stop:453 length:426 start_codon:yes stop_codon:yes gene_type:complete